MAKKEMRENMRETLIERQSTLRRTVTKEAMGEPTPEELQFLANLYDRRGGNLTQLSELCQVSLGLMEKLPPKDGFDFAKKLLRGTYTADMSKSAKADLRTQLRVQIQVKTAELKRSNTKEMTGEASEEDLVAFGEVFTSLKGDFGEVGQEVRLQHYIVEEIQTAGCPRLRQAAACRLLHR